MNGIYVRIYKIERLQSYYNTLNSGINIILWFELTK